MKLGWKIPCFLIIALVPGLGPRPAHASISDFTVTVTPEFTTQLGDLRADIRFKTSLFEDVLSVTAVLEGAYKEQDYASELAVSLTETTQEGDPDRTFVGVARPFVDGFLLLPPGSYTLTVIVITTEDQQGIGVLTQVAIPDIPTLMQLVSRMAAVRPSPDEPTFIDGTRAPRLTNHLQRLLGVALNALTAGGTGPTAGSPLPKVAARRLGEFRTQVLGAQKQGIINPFAGLVLSADAVSLITQISGAISLT